MTNLEPSQILMIGLPSSGKTTFLAALWHVLDDQSSQTKLKLTSLSGDRTYLNRICENWRSCAALDRTQLEAEEQISLHLEGNVLGRFELSVPDLSGESFELQLTERRIGVAYDGMLQKATGIVLFMHPDVRKGTLLTQAIQLEARLVGNVGQIESEALSSKDIRPWSIENVPTQVQLVELLQFVLERISRKLKVAVVISAWDLVQNIGKAPLDFLTRETPLLQQYLVTNSNDIDFQVFGVSAQGGDFPNDKTSLLEKDAVERIVVRHGDNVSNDITRPLAWLLGEAR